MTKTRIIFIGSNSFIAKNVINELSKFNYNIVKITRKLIDLDKQTSIKKLHSIIKDGDIIFFAAGIVPVKNNLMLLKNIKMIDNFIKGVDTIKIKHIYYLSSDAVYSDSMKPLNESSLTKPDNFHGLMHLSREFILKNTFKNTDLTIFRPTLVFGIDDPHNGYGPNSFYRLAKNSKNIILFGNGEERRDHIFVGDLSKLISKCINKNMAGDFNLATGNLYSFMDIAQIIKSKFKLLDILSTERKSLMPHNGYRAFKINKINAISNNFKFTTIEKWIKSL
jgi:UDP-glucose 4-epimerase